MTAAGKLALLASLYFCQGLPFGLFTQALPALLRQRGTSLPLVGLSTLLALPWALKLLWAPWVDRLGSERWGRRKSWIVPLQAAAIAVLLALASAPDRLGLLLAGVLVVNLLAAAQDVATDGLAVDLLRPRERGWGNGVQVAGYRAGMVVGGGALLTVAAVRGLGASLGLAALLLALATIPVLLLREPPRPGPPPARLRPADLLEPLLRPGLPRWLGLIAAYKAGDALAGGMLRPFLVDLGVGLAELGWGLGALGFMAGLVGALLGGALVVPLGRRRALLVFGALQAGAIAGLALLAALEPAALREPLGVRLLWSIVAGEHLAGGMATAALFTAMMDRCRPGAAAADYTAQACVVVAATGLAAGLSGFLAERAGYVVHFGCAAAASLLAVVAVAASGEPGSGPGPGRADGEEEEP